MTSKNLSFKYLLQHNLISRIWAFVLSLFGFIATLILPVFLIYQDYQIQQKNAVQTLQNVDEVLRWAQNHTAQCLSLDNNYVKVVMIVLAILCGVAMFRYLHDRKQVDFYHALPVSRGKLFALNYITGILLVLPLYLVILVGAVAEAYALGIGGTLTIGSILHGIWGNIAYFLLVYTVTVLCTIVTGHTIIAILLNLWAMFGISAYVLVIQLFQSLYYQTYRESSTFSIAIQTFASPILAYFSTDSETIESQLYNGNLPYTVNSVLLGVTVVAVVLIVCSYWLFAHRKSERSGMALAFTPSKTPIKWFMCVLSGFAFHLLFQAIIIGHSEIVSWFGLIFGVVVCHMIVEIIYDFDFKACLHHWKQMIVLVVVCGIGFVAFRADVFGYDQYVPKPSQIAAVDIYNKYNTDTYYQLQSQLERYFPITDTDLIQDICDLVTVYRDHQEDDPAQKDGEKERDTDMVVRYQLKNGNRISRYYMRVEKEIVHEKLIKIITDPEFVKQYQPLQWAGVLNGSDGYSVLTVENEKQESGKLYHSDQIIQVIDQLKQEQIENAELHLEEIPVFIMQLYTEGLTSREDILTNGKAIYDVSDIPVYPSDQKTIALIEQFTGIHPKVFTSDSVTQIQILWEVGTQHDAHTVSAISQDIQDSDKTIRVNDPEMIKILMEGAHTSVMYRRAGALVTWEDFEQIDKENCVAVLDIYAMNRDGDRKTIQYVTGTAPIELIQSLLPDLKQN